MNADWENFFPQDRFPDLTECAGTETSTDPERWCAIAWSARTRRVDVCVAHAYAPWIRGHFHLYAPRMTPPWCLERSLDDLGGEWIVLDHPAAGSLFTICSHARVDDPHIGFRVKA